MTSLDDKGQMTVEMAVMLPVVIVVVFIVFSLMLYLNSCTQFDSAATQAVLVISAQSNKRLHIGRDEACIKNYINQAMKSNKRIEVEVESRKLKRIDDKGFRLGIGNTLVEYKCTMKFYPSIKSFTMAFMRFDAPVYLTHEKVLVAPR